MEKLKVGDVVKFTSKELERDIHPFKKGIEYTILQCRPGVNKNSDNIFIEKLSGGNCFFIDTRFELVKSKEEIEYEIY